MPPPPPPREALPKKSEKPPELRYDPSHWELSVAGTLDVLRVMCDLDTTITPGNISDAAAMFITLMYAKNVTPDWWLLHFDDGFKLVELANWAQAQARVLSRKELPEATRAEFTQGFNDTINEINKLRLVVAGHVELLKAIPPSSVMRN